VPMVTAGLAIAASGIMLTRLASSTPASCLVPVYLAFGIGCGLVNPAITNCAVCGMPRPRAGSPPPSPPRAARQARCSLYPTYAFIVAVFALVTAVRRRRPRLRSRSCAAAAGDRSGGRTAASRCPGDASYASLLELAEACDVRVRWSCRRTGVCHTCETGLLSGAVSYAPDPVDDRAAGSRLIGCSQPRGDLVLDL
jgi:ferredoxin